MDRTMTPFPRRTFARAMEVGDGARCKSCWRKFSSRRNRYGIPGEKTSDESLCLSCFFMRLFKSVADPIVKDGLRDKLRSTP